jgi:hypothetical protein
MGICGRVWQSGFDADYGTRNRLIEGLRSCHIESSRDPWKMAVCFQHGPLIINLPVVYIYKNAVDSGKKSMVSRIHFTQLLLSKPYLMP